MKKALFFVLFLSMSACTRIETGEVGIRIGFDKKVSETELQPGSFNQTIIGTVLTFPVKDVAVDIKDLSPLAKDNSTVKDMDLTVIYSVNPSAVAEIWVEKNRSFHIEHSGDIYLLYNYVMQTGRNAAYKVARNYEALKLSDNRAEMEVNIKETMNKTLADESLGSAVTISQVQIRNILPADSIVQSANELVRAQNELRQKTVEVETAKKEAERIAALNANKGAIEYMNAMANMEIAKGVAQGRVQTIIVPYDFKGIVNAIPRNTARE